jgi:hypothetical protein
MGSPTTLAFEAKRYSEASRFVSLIVGRLGLPNAAVLGCQAHAFVMKLAAHTLCFPC